MSKVFNQLQGQLAEKTIQNYQNDFNRLKKIIGNTRLSNSKKIIKLIQDNESNDAVIGNIYTALIKYMELTSKTPLKTQEKTEELSKQNQAYIDYKIEATKHKKNYNEKPKVIEERLQNIDYKELQNKYLKYVEDKDFKLNKGELLLGFMLLQPPRRLDYTELDYSTSETIPTDTSTNFLLKDKIVFNKSTKVKKNEQQIVDIENEDLKNIIAKMNFENGDTVFHMSKRTIQRQLKKYTTEILGVEINTQQFRVLHSTSNFKDYKETKESIEKDAKAMNHSVITKLKHYIREIEKL